MISKETAKTEIDSLLQRSTGETVEEKYKRLSIEYEEQGDLEKSKQYSEKRATLNPRSIDHWVTAAKTALLSDGDNEKAKECYEKAIALCDEKDHDLFLNYGAFLVSIGDTKEAALFLKEVGSNEKEQEKYIKANQLLSILYEKDGNDELQEKHKGLATRMFLRLPRPEPEEKEAPAEGEGEKEEEKKDEPEGEGEEEEKEPEPTPPLT